MLQVTGTNHTEQMLHRHAGTLADLLGRVDGTQLDAAAERLRATRDAGGTVFIAGNGGSASTATHFACDLGKAARADGRAPIRVHSLSDNTAWLTALSNDEGYDRAFAGQFENFAARGDTLVVISASGNSPNLLAAVECARARAVTTIGLLGFDGGALLDMVDIPVHVGSAQGAYAVVEDAHSALCHTLTLCLCEK